MSYNFTIFQKLYSKITFTSIFFFSHSEVDPSNLATVSTQGLYVKCATAPDVAEGDGVRAKAYMTATVGEASALWMMDIGGGVFLIHDRTAPANRKYLSYHQDDGANIYDLKLTHNTNTDYAKWCLQPANNLGLKITTHSGGDEAKRGTSYNYASVYYPFDIMLPDENGYEIVRKLRSQPSTKRLPIIMVTAKTTEMDMIRGLEDGADDYIKKPFSVMELITRIKALLRRTSEEETKSVTLGNITLDNERRILILAGSSVELTYKEYELLKLLMLNQGIVLSREVIMQKVWGTDFEGESRTVDMHIKTLRHKLANEGTRIKSVRNVGYVME